MKNSTRIVTLLTATSLLSAPLNGATVTWDIGGAGIVTDGNGTWDTTTSNWTTDGGSTNQAFVSGDIVTFGGGTAGAAGTVTLGGNLTVGNTTFKSPFGGGAYILDTSTHVLTLGGTVIADSNATIQSGSGGSIRFTGAGFTVNGSAILTVNANSTSDNGNRNVYKAGSGTLVLNGTNNTAGNGISILQAAEGTTRFSQDQNLGDDYVQLGAQSGSGVLEYTGATGTVDNKVAIGSFHNNLTGAGTILNTGGGTLTFSASDFNFLQTGVTVARTLTFGGTGSIIVSGIIKNNNTGGGGLVAVTKSGGNTLTLNGNNTYTGATLVSVGTLKIGGTNTSAITVASGANLDGEGTTTGALVFSGTTHTINADLSTVSALGSTTSTNVSALTNGQFIVNITGPLTGTAKVLNYGTTFTGSLAKFATGTVGPGIILSGRGATFGNDGSAITLSAGFAARTWNGTTGTWDNGTSTNWLEGDNRFYNGDTVTFNQATSVGTVTLGSNVAVAGMTIENTTSAFTFNSNTITLDGQLTIHNDAAVTINSVLAGTGSLVKQEKGGVDNTSNGILTLSAANTYSGGTSLQEGSIEVTNSAAFGTGTVTVRDLGGDNPALLLGSNNLNLANAFVITGDGARKDIRFELAGTNSAEISGNIAIQATQNWATQIYVSSDNTLTLSGLISGAGNPRMSGAGKLILNNDANSFTSPLYINEGILQITSIANKGVASAAGRGLVGNGNIDLKIGNDFTTGTLNYVGGGDSTDRQLSVGTSGGALFTYTGGSKILNNGEGALVFTNNAFNIADTGADDRVGERTLTLGGSNTDNNEIQGAIINNNGASGANTINLDKQDAGKWILSGTNTYSGTTTVSAGTLAINGNNSAATGAVTVAAGLTDATAVRLKGNGIVGGATSFAADPDGVGSQVGGIHSAGNSVGKQTFEDTLTYNSGSIFEWELGATLKDSATPGTRGTDWDAVNVTDGQSALLGSDAIFRVVLDSSQTFAATFWDADRTWTDIFKSSDGGSALNIASIFSSFQYYNYSGVDGALANIGNTNSTGRSFTVSGSSLVWSAVPEPTSALAGILLGAGLLRRRRK